MASGLLCYPDAETLPRHDETQFLKKYERRVSQILLATLRTQNQHQRESYVFLNSNIRSHLLDVPKNTTVSHSSTDSEMISLDAGLRVDGILALDLWDVVTEVSRSSKSTESSTHQAAGTCSRNNKSNPKQKGHRDVDQLSHVDYFATPAHSSQGESQFTWSRSPTMRHVSRTHRVALDWLCDRINLEPKIQTKFVDTNNQLADTLTKGSFTLDEWNHLLRLLNAMNFSMFSCSHFSNFLSDPNRKQSVMSRRAASRSCACTSGASACQVPASSFATGAAPSNPWRPMARSSRSSLPTWTWSTCFATLGGHASARPCARTSRKLQPGLSGNIKPTPPPPSPQEPPSPPTGGPSRAACLIPSRACWCWGKRATRTLRSSSPTPWRTRAFGATQGCAAHGNVKSSARLLCPPERQLEFSGLGHAERA